MLWQPSTAENTSKVQYVDIEKAREISKTTEKGGRSLNVSPIGSRAQSPTANSSETFSESTNRRWYSKSGNSSPPSSQLPLVFQKPQPRLPKLPSSSSFRLRVPHRSYDALTSPSPKPAPHVKSLAALIDTATHPPASDSPSTSTPPQSAQGEEGPPSSVRRLMLVTAERRRAVRSTM